MRAICRAPAWGEDVPEKSEDVTAHGTSPDATGSNTAGQSSGRFPVGTIELHEPEAGVKPASRSTAAVLPRSEIVWGPPLPPRMMFSDSVLEFGGQRKRKFFATTTSFLINVLGIIVMLLIPLAFTEQLPSARIRGARARDPRRPAAQTGDGSPLQDSLVFSEQISARCSRFPALPVPWIVHLWRLVPSACASSSLPDCGS